MEQNPIFGPFYLKAEVSTHRGKFADLYTGTVMNFLEEDAAVMLRVYSQ
jgi:hypothetical protein